MATKKKASNTTATSYAIAKDLFLVRQVIATGAPTKVAEANVNHLVVIDCSGSMSGDLPQIRAQLKAKLPKLLKEGDTFSLVWFSGKGDFGTLIEAEPVATLKDLADVNKAIDRWLRPIGLTGFKEPLLEVEKLVTRIGKKNKNPFSLFFMSDGCDNQWNRVDVLKAVEAASAGLASSTFVEYGYYADRALLAAMAAKAGGTLIFAEAFDKYEPQFEAAMQRRAVGGKRVEIDITGDPIGGIVYTLDEELVAYEVTAGKVAVPEDVERVFYLSARPIGVDSGSTVQAVAARYAAGDRMIGPDVRALDASYAALSLFAVRMQPNVVFPILKAIGDARFITMFSSCFGKQKYSEFMDATRNAALSTDDTRYVDGFNPSLVPDENAFTVLDLLELLGNDDETRLLLDHPSFKYSRVSRGTVSADENLSGAESEQLEALRAKLAGERVAKRVKEIQGEIDALLASKRDALKFVATASPDGYPINGMVYNEDRANISMRVLKAGHVDLAARKPPTSKIPTNFPTQIWRNYTIVRDGLVNIERLPVRLSHATLIKLIEKGVEVLSGDDLVKKGVKSIPGGDFTYVINVKPLPIINRRMATAPSAELLADIECALIKSRIGQKVLKSYLEDKFPDAKRASFIDTYGEAGAAWLVDQGITEGGFNPKRVQAESTDFYMGRELVVSVKGFSTIPSVNALKKQVFEGKKLNGPGTMMAKAMLDVEGELKVRKDVKAWLTTATKEQIDEVRLHLYRAARLKFAILVGQAWFKEFKSLDENTWTAKLNGGDVPVKFELREVEIHI